MSSVGTSSTGGGGLTGCDRRREAARPPLTWIGRVSFDPTISSLDEFDASTSVLPVRGVILRHRGSSKLIERHKEPHVSAVLSDEILKQEELHVPDEVFKQREESTYLASVSPRGLL
jgi:hypothetical protein